MNGRLRPYLRDLPSRHGGRWVLIALAAIAAVGVGIRSYYALEKQDNVQDDSIRYFYIAQSIYKDHSFDAPEVQRDDAYHPGSPIVHATIWFLTGGVNPKASRIVVAFLSALMILATYLLARRLAWPAGRPVRGPPPVQATTAGLLAALLIAIYPSSIDYYRSMMNEPLAELTLTASMLTFLWAHDSRSPWGWALPGLLIGGTVYFRPEALAFGVILAVLAAVVVMRRSEWRWGVYAGAILLVAMGIAIAPWTARNAIVLHKLTPTGPGEGNALFIGTYLPADGDHFKMYDMRERLMEEYGVPEKKWRRLPQEAVLGDYLELIAAQRYPDLDQDAALSKLGRTQLKNDIEHHTLEYAGVLAKKFWNIWGQGAAAKAAQGGPGPFGDWYHRLVVLLGLAGLALMISRRRWEAWPLGLLLLMATAIGMITLAPPRRNVDLLPVMCALAACAVATLAARRGEPHTMQ